MTLMKVLIISLLLTGLSRSVLAAPAIELPGADGRRVFRSQEAPQVHVSEAPDGAVLRLDESEVALSGSGDATLDLRPLSPGAHALVLRDSPGATLAQETLHVAERPSGKGFFPVVCQFSPVPGGPGWREGDAPDDPDVLRATVDNIMDHGFTGIEYNTHLAPEQAAAVLNHAQARGMVITQHVGSLEGFGREKPPSMSVYAEDYPAAVRERAKKALAGLDAIPRLYNVFPYQDEPFHWGPKSFGYNDAVRAVFQDRYGYPLPDDLETARKDPKVWLDVLNFRSAYFPDGWRHVYRAIKEIDPSFTVTLTHDSHNTFGGGATSHAELALDDVYHWGGDFTDMFVYDIYPYWNLDFRFGEPAKLPLPRMAMTHYTFAHMRNLAYANEKELGFWVGTYNPTWFSGFMSPENEALYWGEREMATTAVAHGADFLLTGYKLPVSEAHWESLGEGLRLLQKAGHYLRTTKKPQARAAMLFPRTHYLHSQEEYFNVGLSFELFLRAFGELDLIHEDQVRDVDLMGYDILLMCDTRYLPREVAKTITDFAKQGGTVIADCVPNRDEGLQPLDTMEQLFGVRDAATGRVRREGHWVPYTVQHAPIWANRRVDAPDESIYETDTARGGAFGRQFLVPVVSPRPCTLDGGQAILPMDSGAPAVVYRPVGRGHAFLLGFCLQDTYFQTFAKEDAEAREHLRAMIRGVCREADVRARVYSANPDIEAALRTNAEVALLFLINHEATDTAATVVLDGLPFLPKRMRDLGSGEEIEASWQDGTAECRFTVPFGGTRLIEFRP